MNYDRQSQLKLSQLQVLIAVADCGSFSEFRVITVAVLADALLTPAVFALLDLLKSTLVGK
jgi:hypothetical protein